MYIFKQYILINSGNKFVECQFRLGFQNLISPLTSKLSVVFGLEQFNNFGYDGNAHIKLTVFPQGLVYEGHCYKIYMRSQS